MLTKVRLDGGLTQNYDCNISKPCRSDILDTSIIFP